jgi:oxygen-dependent protoporphyrinogen oxidase
MSEQSPSLAHGPASFGVAIVGGGISGLSAAYHLSRRLDIDGRLELKLLESTPRLGGQIRTWRRDSLLLEGGPDSLVTQKPAGVKLCRQLGLSDELIRPGQARVPMRLLHRSRLIDLPDGFFMMAPTRWTPLLRSPLFSWRGKARIAAECVVPRRRSALDDESLRSFVTRRFGREAFERAAEPIIGSLFLADANRLSLRMTMPRFLELEERHGSVTLGMSRMLRARRRERPDGDRSPHVVVSLKHGMQSLVERLHASLPANSVAIGSHAERVEFDPALARWRVTVADAPPITADAVILACPGYVSARLLRGTDATLAGRLEQLGDASCATVNLVYDRSAVRAPLDCYGFFAPRTANAPIIACNFSSIKFEGRAPRYKVILRAFVGGATNEAVLRHDDAELARLVHSTLAGLLSIEGEPSASRVHRAPLAMPQFAVGHADCLAATSKRPCRTASPRANGRQP